MNVIDSDTDTNDYVTSLATNNVPGGVKAADERARCVKQRAGRIEGKVAYLATVAEAQSLYDHDKGFIEEVKKYLGLEIVAHRTGNNTPTRALRMPRTS